MDTVDWYEHGISVRQTFQDTGQYFLIAYDIYDFYFAIKHQTDYNTVLHEWNWIP